MYYFFKDIKQFIRMVSKYNLDNLENTFGTFLAKIF